jgi:hypothetical protein
VWGDAFVVYQGHHGDMTEEQKQILTALYYLRTQDSAEDTLRELKARGVIKD